MKFLRIPFGLIILFSLTTCQPSGSKIIIGYVQITPDPVLNSAKSGLFRALADSGFINGQNIKVLDNNAHGDLSMISTILQSLVSQNVDMIITNSTPCMTAAAQMVRNIPVVFTVTFGPKQVGIDPAPKNLHGVYDPWRSEEFIDLIIECIPDLKRVGIPYNNSEPNAEYSAGILKGVFEKRGIDMVTASVTSTNDILQAGQYLVGQDIDAMVVAADNTVFLGLQVLSKLGAENDIPIFVADPLQTEKGAAVGFGVNYDRWGYESGLKAVEILRGRGSRMNPIDPILNYELIINRQACADQGLLLPESVVTRADRILNQPERP